MNSTAILLCGGRSTRMGRSKADLAFGTESLFERVASRLFDATERLIAVAAPAQALPLLPFPHTVLRDPVEGMGPLNGLQTALASLSASTDRIYLASCDCPFIQPEFVRWMLTLIDTCDVAVPVVSGVPQPLAAAYRLEGLADRVARSMASGPRSLRRLLDDVQVRKVCAEEIREVDPELDSLWNVNTPDEYQAALNRTGRG